MNIVVQVVINEVKERQKIIIECDIYLLSTTVSQ